MTEAEIRRFVAEAMSAPVTEATVAGRIADRWTKDRAEAADEARDAIYEDVRDGWHQI